MVKKNKSKKNKSKKNKSKRNKKNRNNKEKRVTSRKKINNVSIENLQIAQVINNNPIIHDTEITKKEYFSLLVQLLKVGGWINKQFTQTMLQAYSDILLKENKCIFSNRIEYYKYLILFDLYHVIGYQFTSKDDKKLCKVKDRYMQIFKNTSINDDLTSINDDLINSILHSFLTGDVDKINAELKKNNLDAEKQYLQLISTNMEFKEKLLINILVTATMSAGKSTFINTLVGKYICRTQNMACTSKIHKIVNKPFEDGFTYKYDYDLNLNTSKEELLENNILNTTDEITISTKFLSELGDERVIINDSPGINFSQDATHKEIAQKMIESKNYNLLIYIMNATQLGTDDEDAHLEYIKRTIGDIPIMFVINKIDAIDPEEEDVNSIINNQISYIEKKGFKNSIVCPVSARAGFLAKQFLRSGLSRIEERELYNLVDKFEVMNLDMYYANNFKDIDIVDSDKEEQQLLKTSGIAYIEKIIRTLSLGGYK